MASRRHGGARSNRPRSAPSSKPLRLAGTNTSRKRATAAFGGVKRDTVGLTVNRLIAGRKVTGTGEFYLASLGDGVGQDRLTANPPTPQPVKEPPPPRKRATISGSVEKPKKKAVNIDRDKKENKASSNGRQRPRSAKPVETCVATEETKSTHVAVQAVKQPKRSTTAANVDKKACAAKKAAVTDASRIEMRVFANGNTYEGEWRNEKMHGRGTYIFKADGSKYVGTFEDGEMSGVGVKTWANGKTYKGNWARGLFHGRGELISVDGDVYTGEFRNGMFHGKGRRCWASGDVYNGRWRDGVRSGRGVLRRSDGFTYKGDWVDGVVHGEGECLWDDAHPQKRYQGEFQDGTRQGRGCLETKEGVVYKGQFVRDECVSGQMILPNGSMYEGELKEWFPEGSGTAHYNDGTSFQGEWRRGIPRGPGERSGPGMATLRGCFGEAGCSGPGSRVFEVDGEVFTYKGQLKDNRMHGKGTLAWPTPNEKVYTGDFYNDSIVGSGRMSWIETGENRKTVYEGAFQEGRFHGQGKLVFANGVVYNGAFHHGLYHGVGKIDMSSLQKGEYSGQWNMGVVEGQGTRIWPNGDVYIGGWSASSKMHGKGSFVWADGSQYVGEFVSGRRTGNGKQIWHTGQYYIGQWRRGQPHGKGILVDPTSGSDTIGTWQRGHLLQELILSKTMHHDGTEETRVEYSAIHSHTK